MRGAAFFMGLRVLRNFNATFKNLDAYAATYPSIGAAFSVIGAAFFCGVMDKKRV